MLTEARVPLFKLVMCLSGAIDLISPTLVGHHKRVAYIALCLAKEMGFSKAEQNNLLLAGLLHDSGALNLEERLEALDFETKDGNAHALLGYNLLKNFAPLAGAALLIKFHHVPWQEIKLSEYKETVPPGSQVLHLADRIEVLINKKVYILDQVKEICDRIKRQSGAMFSPEVVRNFNKLAARESFWFETLSPSIDQVLEKRSSLDNVDLDLDGLTSLTEVFSRIVDFRCSFTATHSSGVAASAEALARIIGFSEGECRMMKVAGFMHDLGKLAVPSQVLRKPDKLNEHEFGIVKCHAYYTNWIFEGIEQLDLVRTWAAYHHERLDGSGYPFHHSEFDIPLGSRVMAVADVFTALTEDRPYRAGMAPEEALKIVQKMANSKSLDINVVSVLETHYKEINEARKVAQDHTSDEYRNLPHLPAI